MSETAAYASPPGTIRLECGGRGAGGSGRPTKGVVAVIGWLCTALLAGTAMLLAAAVSPMVTAAPRLAHGLGFGLVIGQVLAVAWRAPGRDPRVLWATGAACGALVGQSLWGGHGPVAAAIAATALLVAATGLGAAVGVRVAHPGHLLFVAWVSAIADLFSVFHPAGPSHALVHSPRALSLLALPFPLLGTDRIAPFLGGGDAVFAALYLAASRAHRLPAKRTVAALLAGFVAAFCAVSATAAVVPVLPFVSAALLAAQPAARRPPAAERRLAYIVAGLLTLASLALWIRELD